MLGKGIMFKQSDVEITKYNDYRYLIYTRVSSDKDSQKESVPNKLIYVDTYKTTSGGAVHSTLVVLIRSYAPIINKEIKL